MARQIANLKCSICGRSFPRETITKISGKNYCESCYAEKGKDSQAYKDLMDYVYNLAEQDNSILPMVAMQVKKLKEQGKLSNLDILNTLKYMYEYKDEPKMEFRPQSGIANVPYFIREARIFYAQSLDLASTDDKVIEESINCEPIQITLKRSDLIRTQEEFEKKQRAKKNLFLIDLDELELEDDEEPFVDKDILNYKSRLEYRQKHKYDKHTYDWGEDD